MKHVFFAIPAYSGTIQIETFRSVMGSVIALIQRGDRVTVWDESGNAMISHCRDMILAKFLASDATHIVFVDHDVVFSQRSLLRLVDAGVDFVAGMYPQRRDPETYSIQWTQSKFLQADEETGLLEVSGVPAGFLCMTREAVQRMWDSYPDMRFDDANAPDGYALALFDNIRDGRLYYGEDLSFCKRWRDIGGKVWIAPEIKMGHVGPKMFTGSIGAWLRNREAN